MDYITWTCLLGRWRHSKRKANLYSSLVALEEFALTWSYYPSPNLIHQPIFPGMPKVFAGSVTSTLRSPRSDRLLRLHI